MVLWGEMSPQVCRKLCDLVLTDFEAGALLDIAPLKKLASLGTAGKHAQNIWGGFVKLLPPVRLCKPFNFQCPFKTRLLGRFVSPIVDAPAARTFLKHFPWIPRYLEDSSVPRCSLVLSRKLWSKKSNIQNVKCNYVICFSSTSSFVYSWWVVRWVNNVSKFFSFLSFMSAFENIQMNIHGWRCAECGPILGSGSQRPSFPAAPD